MTEAWPLGLELLTDETISGFMDASEIKVLIAKLTNQAVEDIPDGHPEVTLLSNISAEALVDRLTKAADDKIIDSYYAALGFEEE